MGPLVAFLKKGFVPAFMALKKGFVGWFPYFVEYGTESKQSLVRLYRSLERYLKVRGMELSLHLVRL